MAKTYGDIYHELTAAQQYLFFRSISLAIDTTIDFILTSKITGEQSGNIVKKFESVFDEFLKKEISYSEDDE